ncbi:hypothetical protein ABIA06_007087 [Bradyrhizobium yuanmingense]|uniref:hypothetical protein n=1 Tax=Bradyrhizobium yuanmingense TaxID=108015 RepID=UPI0035122E9B
MSNTVTFTAARRRFERSQPQRYIRKLNQAERQGMGSPFALVEGNTIRDAGDVAAVERWCRAAGVLHPSETVTA